VKILSDVFKLRRAFVVRKLKRKRLGTGTTDTKMAEHGTQKEKSGPD